MNNTYTEYINNNTYGKNLGWIYDDYEEKYLPRENGQLFFFTSEDCLVNLEIWLDKEMGSEMFFKWLKKNTIKYGVGILGEETREEISLTYQEITEKISEFRIELDKRLTWEEENIREVK